MNIVSQKFLWDLVSSKLVESDQIFDASEAVNEKAAELKNEVNKAKDNSEHIQNEVVRHVKNEHLKSRKRRKGKNEFSL